MADYFLVHTPAILDGQLRPALGQAWRQRSFVPCVALCRDWTAAAREYAGRYHIDLAETVLAHVESLRFDRMLWRTLAGELLLFAAREVPELPLPSATLSCLLSSDHRPDRPADRSAFQPIHQALYGVRELTFGPAHRPDSAGLNHRDDVVRLAASLAAVRPEETWSADDLAGLPDLDEGDRADELELAREWFPALADLYARLATEDSVLVVEQIF